MSPFAVQSLITVAIAALVIFRFARRELVERTIAFKWLWVRPAIFIVATAYLIGLTAVVDAPAMATTIAMSLAGIVLGIATGLLIVRYSHFRAADIPNAVRVLGNRTTFGIWIGAFAIRLVARFAYPGGATPRAQLPLNCATLMMATAAFVTIAVAFAAEIRRLRTDS